MSDSDRLGDRIQGGGSPLTDALGPRRSLRTRLLLATLGSLLVAAFLFVVVLVSAVRTTTSDASREEFYANASTIGKLVSEEWAAQSEGRGSTTTSSAPSPARSRPTRAPSTTASRSTRPRRTTPTRSQALPDDVADEVIGSPSFRQAIEDEGFYAHDVEPVGNNDDVQGVFVPIVSDSYLLGHLYLTRPPPELREATQNIIPAAVVAAAIGLLAALALTIFLTGRIVRPLNALRGATRAVAEGRPGAAELETTGIDEIDALTEDFNRMVRQLAERDALAREFLMKVTHDLRTPLTAIRGHTSALADGVVPEENVPRSLTAVEGEAARLETMVADLLDLARLDAHQFRVQAEETDPDEVLEHAYMALTATAESKGVALQHQIGRLEPVHTDGARVQQIVGNLLSNALHWTSEGGCRAPRGSHGQRGLARRERQRHGPRNPRRSDQDGDLSNRSPRAESPDGRTGSGLGLAISRQLARALWAVICPSKARREWAVPSLSACPADAREGRTSGRRRRGQSRSTNVSLRLTRHSTILLSSTTTL